MDLLLALLHRFGGFVLCVTFIVLGPWVFTRFMDRRAIRAARAYCAEHGLEVVDIEVYKNHYGLRLMHQGKKAYVRFRVGRGRRMEWVGPVPEVLRPILLQGAA
jgi:hypothetical protein